MGLGQNGSSDFTSEAAGACIRCLSVQLAFVTTTSDSYRQIKLWIDYHKSIGVMTFYLFVDGQVHCSVR